MSKQPQQQQPQQQPQKQGTNKKQINITRIPDLFDEDEELSPQVVKVQKSKPQPPSTSWKLADERETQGDFQFQTLRQTTTLGTSSKQQPQPQKKRKTNESDEVPTHKVQIRESTQPTTRLSGTNDGQDTFKEASQITNWESTPIKHKMKPPQQIQEQEEDGEDDQEDGTLEDGEGEEDLDNQEDGGEVGYNGDMAHGNDAISYQDDGDGGGLEMMESEEEHQQPKYKSTVSPKLVFKTTLYQASEHLQNNDWNSITLKHITLQINDAKTLLKFKYKSQSGREYVIYNAEWLKGSVWKFCRPLIKLLSNGKQAIDSSKLKSAIEMLQKLEGDTAGGFFSTLTMPKAENTSKKKNDGNPSSVGKVSKIPLTNKDRIIAKARINIDALFDFIDKLPNEIAMDVGTSKVNSYIKTIW